MKLLPFQKKGVRALERFEGSALLADDQGLGKTIQSLWYFKRHPQLRPLLIVCPAVVKYSWQAEVHRVLHCASEVLEGRNRKRKLPSPADVVIVNYEILPTYTKAMREWGIRGLIIDEVQYVKNHKARRTRAVRRVSQWEDVEAVIGLSGTPMKSRPIELWSSLRIILPDLFPSRVEYAWRYCKPRHTRWGWKFDGATNSRELNRILRSEVMIRRRKRDVLPELPDKIRKVVPLALPKKAMREFRAAQEDFLGWLRRISPARAKRAKRSQALTKVGYLLRLAAKLKLPQCMEWIDEFHRANPSKKLIALTENTFVVQALSQRYPRSVVVDGKVKGIKRQEAVRKFQRNKGTWLFIGNRRAAGVGITLTASDTVVNMDFPWTPGDLDQGEDRAHRIGQTSTVWSYFLVARGTTEEDLLRLLRKKSDVLNDVLDGARSGGDLVIFDTLLKKLERQASGA